MITHFRNPYTHQLQANMTAFPNGIDGLAQKIHNMGLKYGIYSSAGTMTCGRHPASLGYEQIDAATFASWGVDYLKYDNCFVPSYWLDDCFACNGDPSFNSIGMVNGSCTSATPETKWYSDDSRPFCNYDWPGTGGVNYTAKRTALRFNIMSEALAAQNRTMLFSLCEWGVDQPWAWANQTGQSWRVSNDINDQWSRIVQLINVNSFITDYTNFYGHNDADMLEVGNGDLTIQEERTHFGLWAMLKSPLIIGTNLTALNDSQVAILQNKYLLAFNQDPVVGAAAGPYKWGINDEWTFNSTFPAQYWSGASSNGTMVAMFNPLNSTASMTADISEIPQLKSRGCCSTTNVWTGEHMVCKDGKVTVDVEPHDTAILLFGKECSQMR